MSKKTSVLFVCLGNICRSPIAEGVFRQLVESEGLTGDFQIDSCGTGAWHEGERPHLESQRVAKKNDIDISQQRARQLRDDDFVNFDYIIAMDQSNKADINDSKIGERSSVYCLREFDSEGSSLDVPDPYYGGPSGFDNVFSMIDRSSKKLLQHILDQS